MARVQGAPGHPVVFGAGGVLGEREPPPLLDRAQPHRPVLAGPREDDRDGPLARVPRERPEKAVDGREHAPELRGLHQTEVAAVDLQMGARRDHIHPVRLDGLPVRHLRDDHLGLRLDEFGEGALVMRREVLDEDEGHLGPGRERREELPEGLQPAR